MGGSICLNFVSYIKGKKTQDAISQNSEDQKGFGEEAEAESADPAVDPNADWQHDPLQRQKASLEKKQKQNRPIPQWIRMRTGNTIRYNAKRRHWRRTRSRIGRSRSGSECGLATRSVTTPKGVTGEEPSSSCKSPFLQMFHFVFLVIVASTEKRRVEMLPRLVYRRLDPTSLGG